MVDATAVEKHGTKVDAELYDSFANLLVLTEIEQCCGNVPYIVNSAVNRVARAIAASMFDEWSEKPGAVADAPANMVRTDQGKTL